MSDKEKEQESMSEDQKDETTTVAPAESEIDTEATETTEAIIEDADAEKEFEWDEEPTFEIDYKGECAYEVKVSIASSNEKKQSEEVFTELQGEAEVPGFRRGKVPRRLLEKRFSKAVRGDVTEKLVSAAFRKLVKDHDLVPLALPDVDGVEEALEREEGAPLELTLKFEVLPRVTLGDYMGIEIERPVVTIDDNDIDEVITDIRQRYAAFDTIEEAAGEEDQVVIDFEGTIDGEPFAGNGAKKYPYILGSKRFFPEFEAVLAGGKAGETKECDITFPEDYHGKEVAGKQAHFTITINEVKRRAVPELTEEFAKQAGYESVAEMREKVAAELKESTKSTSDNMAEQNAIDKLLEVCTFELPKSLIESSAHEYFNQEVNRLRAQHVAGSEIEEQEDEIRAEAHKNAEEEIKKYFLLRELGKAEGIEVTEEDMEKEAEAIMERTGAAMDTITRYLDESGERDNYTDRIFRRKAMAVVIGNAKITEKELPREPEAEKSE